MNYTEETFMNWCKPASENEEIKINHSINMIKDAILKDDDLQELDIEIFVQGSYANNTNVKYSSDVDVCIMLKSTFYTEYPDGMKREDYGYCEGSIGYNEYKEKIIKALEKKFGKAYVSVGNKSIKIKSNTYHVEADAVVAFQLRDYRIINSKKEGIYVEGIQFWSQDVEKVTNYPKDHIKNGSEKNKHTNYEYKKLVRIFKHIRNDMLMDGVVDGDKISSFLVECLVWNVPDSIITRYPTWRETVKQSIIYLYNAINDGKHKEWGEVSERLYLFKGRKWTDQDVKEFMNSAWRYLGYAYENC